MHDRLIMMVTRLGAMDPSRVDLDADHRGPHRRSGHRHRRRRQRTEGGDRRCRPLGDRHRAGRPGLRTARAVPTGPPTLAHPAGRPRAGVVDVGRPGRRVGPFGSVRLPRRRPGGHGRSAPRRRCCRRPALPHPGRARRCGRHGRGLPRRGAARAGLGAHHLPRRRPALAADLRSDPRSPRDTGAAGAGGRGHGSRRVPAPRPPQRRLGHRRAARSSPTSNPAPSSW